MAVLRGRWLGGRGAMNRPHLKGTLGLAAISCLSVFVLGAAVTPLLHQAQQTAGWRPTAPQEAAWFQHTGVVSKGIVPGQAFGVVVVFGKSRSIPYTVSSNGQVLSRGDAQRFGKQATDVLLLTASTPGWMTIAFQGIKLPLQVWVRSS